jgi:uncharacterized protein HemX
METNFLKVLGCSVILLGVACQNQKTVSQNDIQNSDSVRQDATQVNIDSAEQRAFRLHQEELIKENNKKIAELKAKIKKERRSIAAEYNKQLDTLDEQNTRMENRLNHIKEQTKNDWTAFQYNFNKDMDSLGKSISRLAERNISVINKVPR